MFPATLRQSGSFLRGGRFVLQQMPWNKIERVECWQLCNPLSFPDRRPGNLPVHSFCSAKSPDISRSVTHSPIWSIEDRQYLPPSSIREPILRPGARQRFMKGTRVRYGSEGGGFRFGSCRHRRALPGNAMASGARQVSFIFATYFSHFR